VSKSEDAQNAASHVLELLVQDDGSIEGLIAKVANDYDLKDGVLVTWLLRSFPSLEALADWRKQRRIETQRVATWQAELETVQAAANEWAQGVWRNCEPDGEPDWDYCCNRFLQAYGAQKEDLRIAARRIFSAIGKRYETARSDYLVSQRDDKCSK